MTAASFAGYLAAGLYLASALLWWRAARTEVPVPISGWDGIVNGNEVREAIRRVNRLNARAASMAAAASVFSGLAVGLAN